VRRDDLRRLFSRARELCGETDYVVMGSLAVLGHAGEVPARMATSIDVDAYTRHDPGRVFGLAPALGQGSPFEAQHGYYLDPISPAVATLPEGWEERLVRIQLGPDLVAWFLEPHDAAVSKYARMEPRDREWIRPGLRAGILSLPVLDARFAATAFVDPEEAARARTALDEDRRWLGGRGEPRRRRRDAGPPPVGVPPTKLRTARPRRSRRPPR
jgi:hypothetical protein